MQEFNFSVAPMIGSMLVLAPVFFALTIWSIAIKGYALWVSARSAQKWWFIAVLVINTVGILELVYLIWFSPAGSNKLSGLFSAKQKASADTPSSPQV